jgi:hypothetical protein
MKWYPEHSPPGSHNYRAVRTLQGHHQEVKLLPKDSTAQGKQFLKGRWVAGAPYKVTSLASVSVWCQQQNKTAQ